MILMILAQSTVGFWSSRWFWCLYTCSKNDVISSVQKHYCAL